MLGFIVMYLDRPLRMHTLFQAICRTNRRWTNPVSGQEKHYGLIVADNGSDWYFQGTEDGNWPDSLLNQLKTIPASQFQAVSEGACRVSVDSAEAACP